MAELMDIAGLIDFIDRDELAQVAGVGSHNAPEGRSLDEVKINAAIKFSGDMIRGFVMKRFPIVNDISTDEVPDLLRGYAADIVRYRLRHRSGNRNTTSDEVENRYNEARDWLKDVSRGLVNVNFNGADGGLAASEAGNIAPAGSVHAFIPDARAPSVLAGYCDD